jgi:hypothetical protein
VKSIPGRSSSATTCFKADEMEISEWVKSSIMTKIASCHHLRTARDELLPKATRSWNHCVALSSEVLGVPNIKFQSEVGTCLHTKGNSWSVRVNISCTHR